MLALCESALCHHTAKFTWGMPADKPPGCMQLALHTCKDEGCTMRHSVSLLMVLGPVKGSEVALAACS